VRYDVRGFGRSTGAADVTGDPADLAALLDHLGLESAFIVGHSRGAAVALAFALAFPQRVRGLVLYGAGPPQGFGLPWDGSDRLPNLRAIARQFGLDSLRAALTRHPLTWAPPQQNASSRARLDSLLRAYSGRDLLEDHAPSNRVPPARMDQLRRIAVPTLVVTGDHELPYFQVVAAALTYGITGAKHVIIPAGGHGAHLAQPERFNAELLSFLDQVAGTTARR
jgi:pimeloyl-ACP methyl ester carboxylesterase